MKIEKPWSEYPIGTKAHAVGGGHWAKIKAGWKWKGGATFPTPGADAVSVSPPEDMKMTCEWEYVNDYSVTGASKKPGWYAVVGRGPEEWDLVTFEHYHDGKNDFSFHEMIVRIAGPFSKERDAELFCNSNL